MIKVGKNSLKCGFLQNKEFFTYLFLQKGIKSGNEPELNIL